MSDWQTDPREIDDYITREDEQEDDEQPEYVVVSDHSSNVYHKPKWVYMKAVQRDSLSTACGLNHMNQVLMLTENTPGNLIGKRPCKRCYRI